MTILDTIQTDLASISAVEVERASRIREPKKDDDKPLGVLHNMEARRLLALAARYGYQSKLLSLRSAGEAKDEAEEKELAHQSDWQDTLCDVAKEIFWGQVRSDIGGEAHSARHLRVRDGWMVVEATCDHCEGTSILGGVIEVPLSLGGGQPSLDTLLRVLRARAESEARKQQAQKPEAKQPD